MHGFDCILSLALTKRGSSSLGNTPKASSPSLHGNLMTWEDSTFVFFTSPASLIVYVLPLKTTRYLPGGTLLFPYL